MFDKIWKIKWINVENISAISAQKSSIAEPLEIYARRIRTEIDVPARNDVREERCEKLIRIHIRREVVLRYALPACVSAKLQLPVAVSPGHCYHERIAAAARFYLTTVRARYTPGKHPACSRPDRFKVFINDARSAGA